MYRVDSGASLHMMGSLSLNNKEKNTLRQSSKILDIQTASGIVVLDTQVKVYMKELGAHLRGTFGGRFTKVIECSIENFVLAAAVYQTKSPLNSRPPKETLSEKKKWRTPCWICWLLSRKDQKNYNASSSTPNARGDLKQVTKEDRTSLCGPSLSRGVASLLLLWVELLFCSLCSAVLLGLLPWVALRFSSPSRKVNGEKCPRTKIFDHMFLTSWKVNGGGGRPREAQRSTRKGRTWGR